MESSQLLREADRAAAAPFLDDAGAPWWHPVAAGLGWGAVAVVVHLYAEGRPGEASAVLAALLVVQMGTISVLRRRRGVWPRMAEAPREVRAAYRWFLLGLVVVGVVAGVLWWLLGGVAGIVVTACGAALVHLVYGRWGHPRAAAQVRDRLR